MFSNIIKCNQILKKESLKVQHEREILQFAGNNPSNLSITNNISIINEEHPQCDYAIITALEKDENGKKCYQ